MRISDWSSDVCSSDLGTRGPFAIAPSQAGEGSVGLMRRFPLIATLIVALAVAAMIGLGVWQLQRMTWKDGLLNSYASAQGLPSIDWPVSPDPQHPPLFRRASADCARVVDWRSGSGRNRAGEPRSEEHTSELQSLMRISYAVFCLKKKK